MDVIVLSAVARDRLAMKPTNCTFAVAQVGGDSLRVQQNAGGAHVVELPDSPRPLQLKIEATPESVYFPIVGHFEYRGDGVLVAIKAPSSNAPPERADFLPVMAARVAQGRAVLLVAFVSRVQDATAETLSFLANVPPRRQSLGAADLTWDLAPKDVHVVNPSLLTGGKLVFDQANVDPAAEIVVLRLKVKKSEAPQLLAVIWPKQMTRTAASAPTPVLMYFHAGVTQNRKVAYEIPGVGTYPNGWDYLFFGLLRYVKYVVSPVFGNGDPLLGGDAPFAKGLSYQVAASGKNVVTILPESRVFQEVGVLLSARSMEEILLEIQSFMFRRSGVFSFPGLGRTALTAFSSGNPLVTTFLAQNQADRFCKNTLQEVYMFDTGENDKDPWAAQVGTWLKSGDSSGKMARIYVQTTTGALSRLIGPPALARSPFVASSANGQRTIAVLPPRLWRAALVSAGGTPPKDDFQSAHQLISATLLTDALRRGGF